MAKVKFKAKYFVRLLPLLLLAAFMSVNATAADKPLILKYVAWQPAPEVNVYSNATTNLFRTIEERSEGRLKFEYYWSGSLLPAKETVAGLQSGVSDIGLVHSAYEPGKLPLTGISGLPGISHDFYPSAKAVTELHEDQAFKDELAKYNLMFLLSAPNTSSGIWSKEPIKSVADMKGKKFACGGGQALIVKALGGVPVTIISSELYQALEKGTVDGVLANPGWANDYKLQEVGPNYFNMRFGNTVGIIIAINKDSWNKIPEDLQKMLLDLRDEGYKTGHEIYQGNAENTLKTLVEQGLVVLTEPTPEDVELLEQAAQKEVWNDYVEKLNKRGFDGQAVLDKWRELYTKWDDQNPFK